MLQKGLFGPGSIRWAQSQGEEFRTSVIKRYFVFIGLAVSLLAFLLLGMLGGFFVAVCYVVLAYPMFWGLTQLSQQAWVYQKADETFGIDLLGDPKAAPAIIEAKLLEAADAVRDAHLGWWLGTLDKSHYNQLTEAIGSSQVFGCLLVRRVDKGYRDRVEATYDQLARLAELVTGKPVVPWTELSRTKKEAEIRPLKIAEAC